MLHAAATGECESLRKQLSSACAARESSDAERSALAAGLCGVPARLVSSMDRECAERLAFMGAMEEENVALASLYVLAS